MLQNQLKPSTCDSLKCFTSFQVGIVVLSIICHIWKIVPDLREAIQKIQEAQARPSEGFYETAVNISLVTASNISTTPLSAPSPVAAELATATEAAKDSLDYHGMFTYCLEKIRRAEANFNLTQEWHNSNTSSTLEPSSIPLPQDVSKTRKLRNKKWPNKIKAVSSYLKSFFPDR